MKVICQNQLCKAIMQYQPQFCAYVCRHCGSTDKNTLSPNELMEFKKMAKFVKLMLKDDEEIHNNIRKIVIDTFNVMKKAHLESIEIAKKKKTSKKKGI